MFQSTHSLRSATERKTSKRASRPVSIHALLAECDTLAFSYDRLICSFNPRTPCGVRPDYYGISFIHDAFQSTHSLRSATGRPPGDGFIQPVSIHALLAECDKGVIGRLDVYASFNPRTPCGVRLAPSLWALTMFRVSIHALLAECDEVTWFREKLESSFNPRTPCGVRQAITERKP